MTQESKTRVMTMRDLGLSLPVGVPTPAGLDKGLGARTFSLREEKEIGRLRDKAGDASMAATVNAVLTVLLTRFGDKDFTKLKEAERASAISQAFIGDVYYAYILLRREALGQEIAFTVRCPACRRSTANVMADLDDLDVRVVDAIGDASWEYELKVPIEVRSSVVRTLKMGPARWYAVESMPPQRGINVGAAKAAIIRASITGTDAANVVLTDDDLCSMSKRDVESVTKAIDANHVGPDMAVETVCPACGEDIRTSLDWSFESFFGMSSR